MTDVTGVLTSYGLDANVPISIDPIIDLLDPTDLPFQNGFVLGGQSALAKGTADNKKMEWQDDSLVDALSTINEGGAYAAGDVTLTVTDGTRFKAGDVLKIEAEKLYVSSISTHDLTVIRGFAGTTDAQHADGTRVICVGQALPEGNDAIEASHRDRDRSYNYTQIFGPRKVQATGTEQYMPKYGLVAGGEMMYQLDKEMIELTKMVERAIIYGTRYDDAADQRTMGGILEFISSNEDSTTTAPTEDAVGDLLESMYDAGASVGSGWIFASNLKQKRVISNIGTVNVERADSGRGTVVEYFDTDVGRVQFNTSRYFEDADAALYTRDNISLLTARPWMARPLAVTGDADSIMLVMEMTLKVKRQSHLGKFSAFA